MYLEKLEIQGFKSFAKKTVIEFPKRRGDHNPGITAIVGPNGTGKSNAADAVRWVLGEQSIKLLRGKRAEDVIFSGSGTKARLGFAEVILHLNNEDKRTNIDYSQVVVKRRVYRNGESEYYLNNNKVRLSDVQLLLAQANFGQKTYSVIGQGMVDSILSSTAQERKNFFDEATGVKQYQIKREQALSKIEKTEENLTQILSVLKEITPRLKSLQRQMKKLEKRSALEKELHELQLGYYGNTWQRITKNLEKLRDDKKEISEQHLSLTKKITELHNKMQKLGQEQKKASIGEYDKVQQKYFDIMNKKNELTGALSALKRELEILQKADEHPVSINTKDLIDATERELRFFDLFIAAHTIAEFKALQDKARTLQSEIKHILKADNKEGASAKEKINQINEKISSLQEDIELAALDVEQKQNLLNSLRRAESKATTHIFDVQKKYQSLQQELNEVSNQKNHIDVELARVETRRNDVSEQIEQEVSQNLRERIKNYNGTERFEKYDAISKIKHELEMIGGIDPEINEEFQETKKKHDFLSSQVEDLQNALTKTKKVLRELDTIIEKEFNRSFEKIEKGFEEYFKILFRGGKASLKMNKQNELDILSEEIISELTDEEQEKLANTFKVGIEINACPPGKKVSSINMLSGGERALTSIALICAIIRANPSPFVVLDEVDAALDESNSQRFAQILAKLCHHTQFIAITHNRETMEQANILYGVTMNEDGVSKLLSVDLEKAMQTVKN
ncbi:AAA family ATPase [Patescibacteria group bacterium]|nr:AAA family ATPase [Patescibacteria group bacterium]